MVSIADVALLAGVSPTTVSHALSGKRKVSDAVRDRVVQAMDELGYVPSRSAQNLARGRTRIVGLVVPDISNGYFAALAKGVETAAMDRGYNVILATTGFEHAREMLYLEMIRSRAVDGIIYAAGAPPTGSELGRVLGNLPVVLVDEEVPGAAAPAFVSDNRAGGRLAAECLLGLGHRRALLVAGADDLESSRQRVEGFREVWDSADGTEFVLSVGGFTEDGGRAAVESYADRLGTDGISCVFAANDLMALGALDALRTAGLESPADVSVVGFDDIGAARYARPRLTTVRQDVEGLGSRAAAALIDAFDSEDGLAPIHHVSPVELVVRDSTGPHSSPRQRRD
jgi:DNA-binding LacI/PurR family transcriptional regulator